MNRFENFDLDNIVTPIKSDVLGRLLKQTNYDKNKTKYLIEGFNKGFRIGYDGPTDRQDQSHNIPIMIGSKTEMWNKVMKEVKARRYAGPFENIPYQNYIQSPIGLVPKDGGKQTRLIFHLSYDFKNGEKSFNHYTPDRLCSVKYNDLDHAVGNCLQLLKNSPVKG